MGSRKREMKLLELRLQLVMWCQDIYEYEASPYIERILVFTLCTFEKFHWHAEILNTLAF